MNIVHAESVALSVDHGDDNSLRWIQVAHEGEWNGHSQGSFEFTAQTFATIIKNFRADPDYASGNSDVVPFDFEHASEQSASEGSIPVSGAPAQAWARELDLRFNAAGQAQLWCLVRYLEPARSYIKEGKLRRVSVAVWFGAKDPKTGDAVGPMLTSIAFTNQPFLKGMVPLAATVKPLTGAPAEPVSAEVETEIEVTFENPKEEDMELKEIAARLGLTDGDAVAPYVDGLKTNYEQIIAALGVDSVESAAVKIAELAKKASDLDALMPEIEALRAKAAEEAASAVEKDVDDAIVANSLPKSTREALRLLRGSNPARFEELYPKVAKDKKHLLSVMTPVEPASAESAKVIPLSSVSGRNNVERQMNVLRAMPGNGNLSHDELWLKAVTSMRAQAR